MNKSSTFLAAFGALILSASPAWAHAFPVKSDPPVGWTVKQPPKKITLWYSMGVQPGLGFIEVESASGKIVSVGPTQVGGADGTILSEKLTDLAPGRYRVSWHVLCVDGHPTRGHFDFKVAPSAMHGCRCPLKAPAN